MTPLHLTISEMRNRGGSFVSGLGSLLCIADSVNKQRLLDAFPEIIQRYAAIAELEETKRILNGSLVMFPEPSPEIPESLNQFTN
jgi:hypothetical protein